MAMLPVAANAGRTVSYARTGQNVTLDLEWTSDNYGDIAWQISNDNGNTWTTVSGATSPTYTFKVSAPTLCRAVISGDPACPQVVQEREIKPVSFSADVVTLGADKVELEVSACDFKDAEIVEYGFTAMMQGIGRTYSVIPRNKIGDKLPEGDSFMIECTGLTPATSYSVRPYFVTADGSLIYGAGKLATTTDGVMWDTEDWIIEKDRVQVPFSVTLTRGAKTPEFWFGKDRNSLTKYDVNKGQPGKYTSPLITGLTPGEEYLAVVKADIDGEEMEISKTVKTWSDYSSFKVDETVTPVSHNVDWGRTKTLVNLTPENLQVEYPRMCRVDENKILLTYHGGATDHWQNSYLRKSYDNGKTWTDAVTLYAVGSPFHGCNYYRICNPEMTKLQNGWIIMTVVANGNPEGNQNSKVLASISKDGGETWGNPIIVGRGRTWEPQVIQMPNGELELLVSSEATWWDTQRDNMFQEILSSRSTDNGETWTAYKRASYKPGARDGMPVSVVMQGNKGVMFIEESVNGGISPSLVHRPLDGEWDTADWDNVADDNRWHSGLAVGAGAPYMIQLPTGEFLIMAHTNQTGSVWQTNRPQIMVTDNTGHNAKFARLPLAGSNPLPAGTGAYYNSFFLYDNETVWLLITKAEYDGTRRVSSDVMMLEGKIVEQ